MKRQVRSFAHFFAAGFENPRHSHTWDQLLYASRGAMTVETAGGSWVLPPQRSCWIPAGEQHSFRTAGEIDLRTLYFPERLVSELPRRCCVLTVTPLLRELILYCVQLGTVDADDTPLIDVVVQQLGHMPLAPLYVPRPRDRRALAVARRLENQPGDSRALSELCRQAGASRRTIERSFLTETGLTLGRWRVQLRICKSLPLLAEGVPVVRVAEEMGYSSASAFVEMFRRNLGETPGRYSRSSWTSGGDHIETPMVPVPTVVADTGERLGPRR